MADGGRTYIAIDLKSFYASVECVERGLDPLKTNLVVADASRTSGTICLAVSPSLKAYGIPGRCRLFELEERLREVRRETGVTVPYITAPPQMSHYIDASASIYAIYLKYVSPDDIHAYSIDEVFIDATAYLGMYKKTPREFAELLIREVFASTGITATAGIGENLYLAKVAMDIVAKHAPPDAHGARIAELDCAGYRKTLWDHRPITDFWQVGGGTAARLGKCGIYTMGDLARASVNGSDAIYAMFGINAELLIDHAWGYETCTMRDIKTYRPETRSMSSGQVLPCPYPYEKFTTVLREMTDSLSLELFGHGLSTDVLTLDVGYDKLGAATFPGVPASEDRYGRRVPLPVHGTANLGTHTSSCRRITDAVLSLCRRITDERLPVRRVTVTACNVLPSCCEQLDIFTDPEKDEKERAMQRAMLDIRKKFGKNAILHGTSLKSGATAIERNGQIGGHMAERRTREATS